jgi:hypothetical protein
VRRIPGPHRTALYEKYGIKLAKSLKRDTKTEVLANTLARERALGEYSGRYLGQPAGILNWYTFEKPFDLNAVAAKLTGANAEFATQLGAHPDLEANPAPQINRFIRVTPNMLVVEIAALDARRHYVRNWDDKTILVDHIYRVAIKDDPPTLEIRAPYGKVDDVFAPVAAILGFDLKQRQRLKIDPADELKLKKSLKATSVKGYGEHAHRVINRSTIEAQPDVDLQDSDEYKAWLAREGVKEFAHAYVFKAPWPDGYEERVGYKVDRDSGEVSIRTAGASEIAIDHLRKHVVAIA